MRRSLAAATLALGGLALGLLAGRAACGSDDLFPLIAQALAAPLAGAGR